MKLIHAFWIVSCVWCGQMIVSTSLEWVRLMASGLLALLIVVGVAIWNEKGLP